MILRCSKSDGSLSISAPSSSKRFIINRYLPGKGIILPVDGYLNESIVSAKVVPPHARKSHANGVHVSVSQPSEHDRSTSKPKPSVRLHTNSMATWFSAIVKGAVALNTSDLTLGYITSSAIDYLTCYARRYDVLSHRRRKWSITRSFAKNLFKIQIQAIKIHQVDFVALNASAPLVVVVKPAVAPHAHRDTVTRVKPQ